MEKLGCSDQTILSFQRWIFSQGLKQHLKLKLKHFPSTGRGLMTMTPVSCGDTLVNIPFNLLITAASIANTPIGKLFIQKQLSVPLHLVFSAFIVYEKHLRNSSQWNEYIAVLPSSFTSPLFCSEDELSILPDFISYNVNTSRRTVNAMLNILMTIMEKEICDHCSIPMASIFSCEIFSWAWFVVNSRVVYIPPSENKDHPIPLSDSNCMALAPYLDMLNHSNSARVTVSSSLESGYSLITLVPFKKFSQVFIHYGDHGNLKLLLDYGFVLSENEHDIFPLCVDDIVSCILNIPPQTVENNLAFIRNKCSNFLDDLYCSSDGLSWNCKVLIYLLSRPYEIHLKSVMRNVYQGTFEEDSSILNLVSRVLVEKKIVYMEDNIKKLSTSNDNNILSICLKLLYIFLSLLQKCYSTLF